jgi:hypothetical protein
VYGLKCLLIGNHYFPPDTKPEVIINYFRSLENKLGTPNFRVTMVGDFNKPGFDWSHSQSLLGCHYYSKLKGDAIYSFTCLLNLHLCIDADDRTNLLELIFYNFSDIGITFLDSGIIKPDIYHPPFVMTSSCPLSAPLKIASILIVSMCLGIILYYT